MPIEFYNQLQTSQPGDKYSVQFVCLPVRRHVKCYKLDQPLKHGQTTEKWTETTNVADNI